MIPLTGNPNVKYYAVAPMQADQQKKVTQSVLDFLIATADMKEHERKIEVEKKRIAEEEKNETREIINNCLRLTFGTDEQTLKDTIHQNQLDRFGCLIEKKCLTIDDEAMHHVILAFAKAHKTENLDLRPFKDEFKGTSLIRLFNELPQTDVKTVTIAKQLNDQELQWKQYLETTLTSRDFKIIIED